MNKAELRKSVLNVRKNFDGEKESEKICGNVKSMAEYKNAQCVAAFVPYKSEVNILPLIEEAMKTKKVCFPVTDENDSLEFYFAESISELVSGRYGILEPKRDKRAEKIDFMVVPGAVFGKDGFRIGYGKGCYDRYLCGKNIFTCAVGYSFQLKETAEHETHDVKMRAFVDETEILYF